MTEQLVNLLSAFVSSGSLGISALILFRLTKLEKAFEKHNDTLVNVQKEIAYMKGQNANVISLQERQGA